MKDLLTISQAELEEMPRFGFENLARYRAKQIDDIVMPLLKPWQRKLVLSGKAGKWYMRPLVRLAKRTAGITIEHHNSSFSVIDNSVRMESKIVVKQHGKVVS